MSGHTLCGASGGPIFTLFQERKKCSQVCTYVFGIYFSLPFSSALTRVTISFLVTINIHDREMKICVDDIFILGNIADMAKDWTMSGPVFQKLSTFYKVEWSRTEMKRAEQRQNKPNGGELS